MFRCARDHQAYDRAIYDQSPADLVALGVFQKDVFEWLHKIIQLWEGVP